MQEENKKLKVAIGVLGVIAAATDVAVTFIFWDILNNSSNLGVMTFLLALILAPFTIFIFFLLYSSVVFLITVIRTINTQMYFMGTFRLYTTMWVILIVITFFAIRVPIVLWEALMLVSLAVYAALFVLMKIYKKKFVLSAKKNKNGKN